MCVYHMKIIVVPLMLYISVDCIHHGAVTVVWQMKFTGYIMTGINNISSVTVTGINVVEL